jgi:hypothetical protein
MYSNFLRRVILVFVDRIGRVAEVLRADLGYSDARGFAMTRPEIGLHKPKIGVSWVTLESHHPKLTVFGLRRKVIT